MMKTLAKGVCVWVSVCQCVGEAHVCEKGINLMCLSRFNIRDPKVLIAPDYKLYEYVYVCVMCVCVSAFV